MKDKNITLLNSIKTTEDLYNYAAENGLEKTKELLKLYVDYEQPCGFAGRATPGAILRLAGAALDGIKYNALPPNYNDTKYGTELYFYMWGKEKP